MSNVDFFLIFFFLSNLIYLLTNIRSHIIYITEPHSTPHLIKDIAIWLYFNNGNVPSPIVYSAMLFVLLLCVLESWTKLQINCGNVKNANHVFWGGFFMSLHFSEIKFGKNIPATDAVPRDNHHRLIDSQSLINCNY